MALQVTISGTTQIYFGGQTALTASVIDTETGQAPAGLQYAWTASDGSSWVQPTARAPPITPTSPGTPTKQLRSPVK